MNLWSGKVNRKLSLGLLCLLAWELGSSMVQQQQQRKTIRGQAYSISSSFSSTRCPRLRIRGVSLAIGTDAAAAADHQ